MVRQRIVYPPYAGSIPVRVAKLMRNTPASEKRPNQPVTILPSVSEDDFVDLEPDGDLFGTDDLFGLDVPVNDEGASE